MKQIKLEIEHIPAILWGDKADKIYLYVHGQGGFKEEAKMFAEIATTKKYQVLSIDLPQHGERHDQHKLEPQDVICELHMVMEYLHKNWEHISLCANSIGAWFAMMSYAKATLDQCLLVSPIVDMRAMILKMMMWANVDMKQLETEKLIATDFNQTLSWDYFVYVCDHPIVDWKHPTHILYAEHDTMMDETNIREFQNRFACTLTIMKNGEHWFHTPEQLKFEANWFQKNIG